MRSVKLFTLALTAAAITIPSVPFKAKAQASQPFSQCVEDLDNSGFNYHDATTRCLEAYKGKPFNDNLSTCIKKLDELGFNSRDAANKCQEAIDNSSSVAGPVPVQVTPARRAPRTTAPVIVVPGLGPLRLPGRRRRRRGPVYAPQQRTRRTERQCINTMFNTVWDDIHCKYHNNGMFKWRTIYLD